MDAGSWTHSVMRRYTSSRRKSSVRCGTGNGSSGAFGPLGPGVPGAMRNDPNEARACGFAEKRREAMLRTTISGFCEQKSSPLICLRTPARGLHAKRPAPFIFEESAEFMLEIAPTTCARCGHS